MDSSNKITHENANLLPVQIPQTMEPEVKEKAEPFQVDPMGSMIQNEISAIKDASQTQIALDVGNILEDLDNRRNPINIARSR